MVGLSLPHSRTRPLCSWRYTRRYKGITTDFLPISTVMIKTRNEYPYAQPI
jgi:hypothetical protein